MVETLFIYWFGEANENVANIVALFEERNIKVLQAKDDPEHEELLINNKVYKKYFKNKKYAFASDIWRFYKLSKTPNALYLDSGDKYNDIESIINFDKTTLLKENIHFYNSGMIYNKNDCDFFKKVLKYVNLGYLSPAAVTKAAKKEGWFKKDWRESNKINSISLYDFSKIANVHSYASWKKIENEPYDNWSIKISESKENKYKKTSRKILFAFYSKMPRLFSKFFTLR